MRLLVALLFSALMLTSGAAAVSYALYSPTGELDLPTGKVPVSINLGGRADLDAMANAYSSAIKTNLSASSIAVAKNNTLEALERAKSDDVAYIQTPERNLLLRYRECDEAQGYTICFTAITYPEEDGPPLGDRTLSTVKVVNGSYQLPVTITAVAQEGKLTATRTLNPTSVYPDTSVIVTDTLTNTGTAPILGVRIDDISPLLVLKGEPSARIATLGVGESLIATYTVKPTASGNYTFSGIIAPASMATLPNATLLVKDFVSVKLPVGIATTGKSMPFDLLVQNTYKETMELTVTVRGGILTGTGSNWSHKGPSMLDTYKVKLPVSATMNLTGSVVSNSAGTDVLSVEVEYTADTKRTETFTFPYAVREQSILATPVASIGALELTLTSDATVRTDAIEIAWGDGSTESIALLQADRSITLTHKYPLTTVSPVTVGVTAQIGTKPFNKSVSLEIPGLSGAPLAPPTPVPPPTEPSTPQPSVPPSDAPTTPPTAQQPAQPATAPAPLAENGPDGGGYKARSDGMIKRFLRWFNGLFT